MTRIKALFYLPLRDNDGSELTEEIETLEAEVFVRFSGWTLQDFKSKTSQESLYLEIQRAVEIRFV